MEKSEVQPLDVRQRIIAKLGEITTSKELKWSRFPITPGFVSLNPETHHCGYVIDDEALTIVDMLGHPLENLTARFDDPRFSTQLDELRSQVEEVAQDFRRSVHANR